ncbi:MAG: hypothetical protein KC457_09260, partial [Myxococcales bacterium]|nr:hypothetical protein [Myxococcales bacterium]
MQRLAAAHSTLLLFFSLALMPACKGDAAADGKADGAKADDGGKADEAGAAGADGGGAAEAGAAEAGAGAEGGGAAEGGAGAEGAAADGGAAAEGGAETGAAQGGEAGGTEGQAAETGGEDVVAGLLEQAKNLETDDAAAKKALEDAIKAGANKLDAAKITNARGEALMTDGESERAEVFFVWAR